MCVCVCVCVCTCVHVYTPYDAQSSIPAGVWAAVVDVCLTVGASVPGNTCTSEGIDTILVWGRWEVGCVGAGVDVEGCVLWKNEEVCM